MVNNSKAFYNDIKQNKQKNNIECDYKYTTYVSAIYSNTIYVSLGEISSLTSIILNVDSNQTIRSVQTRKITTASAVKEAVSSQE